jgi:branched-chain amino acid transport system ATP-binding protein
MSDAPLLALDAVEVMYEDVITALRGVTLQVATGGVVALLGANGAGKSTTLKAISQLLAAERGQVVAGQIRLDGQSIAGLHAHRLVALGVSQVLEGRRCFAHLSVEENLLIGGYVRHRAAAGLGDALERVYARFPRLKTLRRRAAGYTSGGEQQMVAIGRALMSGPRLVLLDEPSMGLAPIIVSEIFDAVRELNQRDKVSFLLAEQNATLALQVADQGYVLENGRVALQGSAADLLARDDIKRFYLGENAEGRARFIDPHRLRKRAAEPTRNAAA